MIKSVETAQGLLAEFGYGFNRPYTVTTQIKSPKEVDTTIQCTEDYGIPGKSKVVIKTVEGEGATFTATVSLLTITATQNTIREYQPENLLKGMMADFKGWFINQLKPFELDINDIYSSIVIQTHRDMVIEYTAKVTVKYKHDKNYIHAIRHIGLGLLHWYDNSHYGMAQLIDELPPELLRYIKQPK